MVSVVASSVVDCGFIAGVMVSVIAYGAVDGGFISGVIVSQPLHPRLTHHLPHWRRAR
jgi:hypothetical protein